MMSDCSTNAFTAPVLVKHPPKPTLRQLADEHGEPPWELELPDYGVLPEEATRFVEAVRWRGVRFERVRGGGDD